MKVRVFGTLRSVVGGRKEIDVQVDARSTTSALLDQLAVAYPGLKEKVLVQSGELQGGVTRVGSSKEA